MAGEASRVTELLHEAAETHRDPGGRWEDFYARGLLERLG